jgi:hypothetical protein
MRQVALLASFAFVIASCTRSNPGNSGSPDLSSSGGGGGGGSGGGSGGGGGGHDLAMSMVDLAGADMLSPTYDGVICGSAGATAICKPPTPLCCLESNHTGFCVAVPPPSPCQFVLACDGREDCQAPDVCCLQSSAGGGSSSCTPGDQCKSTGQTRLCHPGRPVAAECGAGFGACCPVLSIPGYGYCAQPPCT